MRMCNILAVFCLAMGIPSLASADGVALSGTVSPWDNALGLAIVPTWQDLAPPAPPPALLALHRVTVRTAEAMIVDPGSDPNLVTVEAGPVLGLWPERGMEALAGRIGFGLWTPPDDWLIVGGHRLFVDFLLAPGDDGGWKGAIGASSSLSKAENERGVRLGGALWHAGDSGLAWEVYCAYGIPVALFEF